MPELPEVETVRRQLAPEVEGNILDRLEVIDARWCAPAPPAELAAAVEGRRIEQLSRRGKHLIWELEDETYLVMHLRMTGNLLFRRLGVDHDPTAYVRARLVLGAPRSRKPRSRQPRSCAQPGLGANAAAGSADLAAEVLFRDPRRFGTGLVILGDDARSSYFSRRLGVEPLSPEFTADALRALAAGRRVPVKAFLLSQERLAGVGNIYADEALFRARIHPLRPVGSLTRPRLVELRDAVVASLERGIDAGGATIDDFRHTDGARGSSQDRLLVHRREGEPCPRCGRRIRKLRAAGRGTYVCERCQPPPRIRRSPPTAGAGGRRSPGPTTGAGGRRSPGPTAGPSGRRSPGPTAAA